MNTTSLIHGVLAGLIAGFLTHIILIAFSFPPYPWALLVGILVFLGYAFSGFPARRL